MAEHTPARGPWDLSVVYNWGDWRMRTITHKDGQRERLIAHLQMDPGDDREMQNADARLIAAAPELLAALEEIADALEREQLLFIHMVRARAVISKAKGVTP